MAKSQVQDTLLNTARKDRLEVNIFLVNGFQIKGIVTAFDDFVIIVMSGSKQQMIFKHAISTILPSKSISLMQHNNNQVSTV